MNLNTIDTEAMKWTQRESLVVLIVTLVSMVAASVIFGGLAVSWVFLFWNFIVVLLFLVCFQLFRNTKYITTPNQFQYALFFGSIAIRLFAMFVLYIIFYDITGTAFDVEAIDALWYHDLGLEVARQIREAKLDLYALTRGGRDSFDDVGYGIFLGIVYYMFAKSIIVVRIIQCLLDSLSVVLIYKISKGIWGENVARLAGILSMLFPLQILYTALHLKETLLVFVLLVGILACYRLSYRIQVKSLMLLIASAIGLVSMRTALFIIFIASIIVFYTISKTRSLGYKMVLIAAVSFSIALSLNYLGLEQEPYSKTLSLIGLDDEVTNGGRSKGMYVESGQGLGDYASLPVLAVQGFLAPYPSMVRTNIVFYDQTMQWYQIGALFVWGHLVFFALYGFYFSLRFHFKASLLLSTLLIGYTAALVISVYVMSIRYNIVKLILFIPFIALGISNFPKSKLKLYYLYCCFFGCVVLAWNFVKLYGRGYL